MNASAETRTAPLGLTRLTTFGNVLATKTWTRGDDGKPVCRPYGDAKHFRGEPVAFSSFEEFYGELQSAVADPHRFYVRGAIRAGVDASNMRRLLYPHIDEKTGGITPATIEPCPRSILNVDIDIENPPPHVDPVADPDGALEYLLGLLPELADIDLIVMWSSSTGIRPKLAAHLIAVLDRPHTDEELTRWADAHRDAGVDPAVFRAAQPYYTAVPIFRDGVTDPLGDRRLFRRSGSQRFATLTIPPKTPPQPRSTGAGLKDCHGFEAHLARIGTEAGFFGPIKAAIAAYVGEHGASGTDTPVLIATLRVAILSADPGGRDEAEISTYASEKYLSDKITWTLAQQTACEPVLIPVTAEDLLARKLPPLEFVLDPIARIKDIAMAYAPRGAGKTWFSISLSLVIAAGGRLFGRWDAPIGRGVLHVDGEMAAQSLQQRLAQLVSGSRWDPEGRLRFLAADLHEDGLPNLATAKGQRAIDAHLQPGDVLVLDNVSCLFRGLDENEAAAWDPVQEWFLELRRRGHTVFLIHHAGKSGVQRGTSKREDILNTVFQLRLPEGYEPGDGASFVIHFEKARDFAGRAAEDLEVELKVTPAGAKWEARSASTDDRILELHRQGMSMKEIAKVVDKSVSTVSRRLAKLRRDGRVKDAA